MTLACVKLTCGEFHPCPSAILSSGKVDGYMPSYNIPCFAQYGFSCHHSHWRYRLFFILFDRSITLQAWHIKMYATRWVSQTARQEKWRKLSVRHDTPHRSENNHTSGNKNNSVLGVFLMGASTLSFLAKLLVFSVTVVSEFYSSRR